MTLTVRIAAFFIYILTAVFNITAEFPHYYQTDPRWKDINYNGSKFEDIGCMITSFAGVATYLKKEPVTPEDIVTYSIKTGSDTPYGLDHTVMFKFIEKDFHIKVTSFSDKIKQETKSYNEKTGTFDTGVWFLHVKPTQYEIDTALSINKPVIITGPVTTKLAAGPHAMIIYGKTGNLYRIMDPGHPGGLNDTPQKWEDIYEWMDEAYSFENIGS